MQLKLQRMNTRRKCPICKDQLKGRADQRFCSLQCKNEYHIKLRRATKKATGETDKILHRNRSILLEIMRKKINEKESQTRNARSQKFSFRLHHRILPQQARQNLPLCIRFRVDAFFRQRNSHCSKRMSLQIDCLTSASFYQRP